MSKIFDVKNMYGQDFSVVTTNAPTNIIKSSQTKLLANTILISSPEDENTGLDNNLPSIFVTDYNAQPLQLTYPLYMKNGLNYSDKFGYAYINIDNSTIKTEFNDGSGRLKVDTANLDSATFNSKGVVRLSTTAATIDRQLSEKYKNNGGLEDSVVNEYNSSTFINVNNDGILYLDNNFLGLINSIVDIKIRQKLDSIKVLLNNNLKMWIIVKSINGNNHSNTGNDEILKQLRTYNVGVYDHMDVYNDNYMTVLFDLQYFSFNNVSEKIDIVDESGNIYKITFGESGNQTTVEKVDGNDELYIHTINDIEIIFLPNYFILNNDSYDQNYQIIINVDDDKAESMTFKQKKLNFVKNGDQKFDLGVDTNQLDVAKVFTTDEVKPLIDTHILNDDLIKPVKINNQDVLQFNFNAFIENNTDKNNNFTVVDNVECNFNKDQITEPTNGGFYYEGDVYKYIIKNYDNNNNNNTESLLYSFIRAIINDNKEDKSNYKLEGGDNYNNTSVNVDEYTTIKIGDFIKTSINASEENGTEIEYSINLLVEFTIKNIDSNKELGTYSVTHPIILNLSKINANGFANITSISMSKGLKKLLKSGSVVAAQITNMPNYIYYKQRAGGGRILANVEEYSGKDIDPTTLYCIFNDDLLFNDEENENATFTIKHNGFKKYSSDTPDNDTDIIQENISVDDSLCTITNDSIVYNLGTNNDERMNNIDKLLSNGLAFTISFTKNKKDKSISEQLIKMNVNILEILLSNISIKESSYTYDDKGKYLNNAEYVKNLNDFNDPLYYNMNNYVIKSSINNNDIEKIYFNIPNYLTYALTEHDIKLNLEIIFYYRNNIEKATISIINTNDLISAQINTNIPILVLNHASFDVTDDKSEHFFILTTNDSNKKLPKLLQFKFNFTFNDLNTNKLCYFIDNQTVTGGDIIHKPYDNQLQAAEITQVYENTVNSVNDKLYDIVYVISNNGLNNITTTTKADLFHEESYGHGTMFTKLNLSDDIQYPFTLTEINKDTNNDKYNIILKIDNSNWKESLNSAYLGLVYKVYYNYYYLKNQLNALNDYNAFVDSNSKIEQQLKEIESNYYIRFTEVSVNMDLTKINPQNENIFCIKSSDNLTITILSFEKNKGINYILKKILNITINNGGTYSAWEPKENEFNYIEHTITQGKSLKGYYKCIESYKLYGENDVATKDTICWEKKEEGGVTNYVEVTVTNGNSLSGLYERIYTYEKYPDNATAETDTICYEAIPKYWEYNEYTDDSILNKVNFINSDSKVTNASNLLFSDSYSLFLNNYQFALSNDADFKSLYINNLYLGYSIIYANVDMSWNGFVATIDEKEQTYKVERNICTISINQIDTTPESAPDEIEINNVTFVKDKTGKIEFQVELVDKHEITITYAGTTYYGIINDDDTYDYKNDPIIKNTFTTPIANTLETNDMTVIINNQETELGIDFYDGNDDMTNVIYIETYDKTAEKWKKTSIKQLINDIEISNSDNPLIQNGIKTTRYPIYINNLYINGNEIQEFKTKYSLKIGYDVVNTIAIGEDWIYLEFKQNGYWYTSTLATANDSGAIIINSLSDIRLRIVAKPADIENSPWMRTSSMNYDVTAQLSSSNNAISPTNYVQTIGKQGQDQITVESNITNSINNSTLDTMFTSYNEGQTTTITLNYSGNEYYKEYNKSYKIYFKEQEPEPQQVSIKFINTSTGQPYNNQSNITFEKTITDTQMALVPAKVSYNGQLYDYNITYTSSDSSIASISGDNIIFNSTGTVTITAAFAGNSTYSSASGSYTITIKKATLGTDEFKWSTNAATVTTTGAYTDGPTLLNTHNLPVTYSSSNTNVAEINTSTGAINIPSNNNLSETVTISAIFEGNTIYNSKTVTYELTVSTNVQTS